MSSAAYIGEKLNSFPHGLGVYISSDGIFEGTWEKGLRVNKGLYKFDDELITVKFKEGKIYKLLQIENQKTNDLVSLKQLNYLKQGDFFQEIPGTEICSFVVHDKKIFFDGLSVKKFKFFELTSPNSTIYGFLHDFTGIKEIRIKDFKYVCRLLNKLPLGPIKISKNNKCIKGQIIGYKFRGECKVKQGNLKLSIQKTNSFLTASYKISSKEKGILMSIEKTKQGLIITKEIDLINFDFLYNFFIDSLEFYNESIIEIMKFSKGKWFIMNSLMAASNWLQIEKDISIEALEKEQIINNEKSIKLREIETIDNKSKKIKRIRYADGSFYYGEVKNDIRDGLGCFVFPNGSRYKGYFRNSLFCGKGYFDSISCKISGYWENNTIKTAALKIN